MATLFGLPLDKLSNLTANRELVPPGEEVVEKLRVVGGYKGVLRELDAFFGYNVTADTQDAVLLSQIAELYTIVPVIIILLCQIGFAMLQSGASRVESAALPFVTNILVLATSSLSYWAVGYALGRSDGYSMVGFRQWFSHNFELESFDWLLHFSLVLTTANVATSGGLERCPPLVYCLLSPIVASVLGSFAGRWSWHSEQWTAHSAPFNHVVFKDHGGAGAIHVVGGTASLMLSVTLGPRYSRIRGSHTKILYNDLDGHSLPLEMLGWYLCIVCFLCCNFVRVTATCIGCKGVSQRVARALVNSLIAAATASLGNLVFIHIMKSVLGRKRFHYLTSRLLANGLLIGIVSVAAGADTYYHWAACVIGVTSSIGYVLWCQFLYCVKIDDPVGTISVHLGGGFWGLVCLHMFVEKTGVLFAEVPSTAALAVLWNAVVGLMFAVGSAFVTGAVLMIPKLFSMIPIRHAQELQGVDSSLLTQHAYPSGDTVTPFTTDLIEDRENFIDSNQTSPQTTVTSPMSYSFTRVRPEHMDLPGQHEMSNPYQRLEVDLKSLPSFTRSPADVDRRVWFSGECLPDQVAPSTPIIDYLNREYDRWDDVEF